MAFWSPTVVQDGCSVVSGVTPRPAWLPAEKVGTTQAT